MFQSVDAVFAAPANSIATRCETSDCAEAGVAPDVFSLSRAASFD